MNRKAVVFIHLSMPNVKELHIAERDGKLSSLVWSRWGDLFKSLGDCAEIKLAYLFLSDAYIAYVTGNEHFREFKRLELAIEAELVEAIQEHIGHPLTHKFRIVGMTQLQPLLVRFSALSTNLTGSSLNQLLLGGGSELFYDCPKIPEAIIRIARRHMDEPILRFDQDVIIDAESVRALIKEYDNMRAQGEQYFFFSGSYRKHDRSHDPVLFWLNDFAVRTHLLSESMKEGFRLNIELAEKFIFSIPDIGPDVYSQPISGAGLCISPMAITQLPPFANVGRNIVWIDDAIKRALHVGIGDIEPNAISEVPHAQFLQDRYDGPTIEAEEIEWAFTKYLPRLVHGCLMHSTMVDLSGITPAGPYAQYFMHYMRGKARPTEQQRREWADAMLKCLTEMRKVWTAEDYQSCPMGQRFSQFADTVLDANSAGCISIIDDIVKNPCAEIDSLCKQQGLTPGNNAASFVAGVIVDLERYVELMDIWPYIIRTIDFEIRQDTHQLSWLVRDAPSP